MFAQIRDRNSRVRLGAERVQRAEAKFVVDTPSPSKQPATPSGDSSHISRPYGLQELHDKGITGEGVTIAVVDTGIAPHPDFQDRIVTFRDFSDGRTVLRKPFDIGGHGTHVAGVLAGKGEEIVGIAPDSNLVGCRVTNEGEVIRAIDWVIKNREKYSIDILNLSLGVKAPDDPAEDKLRSAAERAVEAGLVVVTAAGNELTPDHCSVDSKNCESTISSPGNSPDVITVGVLDDRGTPERGDDGVYRLSSRGGSKDGKPDLVAEGVGVLAPLAAGSTFAQRLSKDSAYIALAGSSQATPMVAGAAALMLQVNRDLSHPEIKDILKSTAEKLNDTPVAVGGSGRLDLQKAVESAQSLAS